ALDGLKVQWREASENLGASAWQYWRHVGGPLLAPAFFGSLLLLFANALSAYATIQAWENQIPYVVPQLIGTALTSEVGLSNANHAQVLAVGLIIRVVVTLELGVLTAAAVLVLLVPTMIWIKLRVPWISRTVEFLCLLPLTIPAIVLVVGLVPVYNWIQQRNISTLMLFWVYVILV